jgi:hypothetical protein
LSDFNSAIAKSIKFVKELNNYTTDFRAASFIAILFAAAGTAISICLGQDFGPDLINYHHYAGDAVLNGNGYDDIYVAALQGFFNPLPYVPYVLLFQTLPPVVAGGIIGAIHAQIGLAAYLLAIVMMSPKPNIGDQILAACAGLLAFASPFVIGTLGGSFSDVPQSIIILFSLALFFWALRKMLSGSLGGTVYAALFFAGFIAGAGAGIKVSYFFYATAFIPVVVISAWSVGIKNGLLLVVSFGLGGLLGGIGSNLWWFSVIYNQTGSPLYPYAQTIISSNAVAELGPESGNLNFPAQAAVKSLHEFLIAPLNWAQGKPPPTEWYFVDNRILIFWLTIFAASAVCFFSWLASRVLPAHNKDLVHRFIFARSKVWIFGYLLLCIYFVSAYIPWIFTLGAIRYAIALFAIAGIIIVLIIASLPGRYIVRIPVAMLLVYFVVSEMRSVNFGRQDWDNSWAKASFSDDITGQPALYIMDANSFWIPQFNADSEFIRLAGLLKGGEFLERASDKIENFEGELRLMVGAPYGGYINGREKIYSYLADLGLSVDFVSCRQHAPIYSFHVCDIRRIAPKAPNFDPLQFELNDTMPAIIAAAEGVSNRYHFGRQTLDSKARLKFVSEMSGSLHFNVSVSSNTPVVPPSFVELSFNGNSVSKWLSVYPEQLALDGGDQGSGILEISDKRRCLPNGFLGNAHGRYSRVNLFNMEISTAADLRVAKKYNGTEPSDLRSAEKLPEIGEKVISISATDGALNRSSEAVSGLELINTEDGFAAYSLAADENINISAKLGEGAYRLRISIASPAPQLPMQVFDIRVAGTTWPIRTYSCFSTYSVPFRIDDALATDISINFDGIDYPLAISNIDVFKVPETQNALTYSVAPSARSKDFGYANFGFPGPTDIWLEADHGAVSLPVIAPEGGYVLIKGNVSNFEKRSPVSFQLDGRKLRIVPSGGSYSVLLPVNADSAIRSPLVDIEIEVPDPTKQQTRLGRLSISQLGVYPRRDLSSRLVIDLSQPNDETDVPFGLTGFSVQEPNGKWTDGDTAIVFLPLNLPENFDLILEASAFADNSSDPVRIAVGSVVRSIQFSPDLETQTVEFRRNSGADNKIVFNIPHPTAPSTRDTSSGDERMLGIYLSRLMILPK